jgi:hypothetical protein
VGDPGRSPDLYSDQRSLGQPSTCLKGITSPANCVPLYAAKFTESYASGTGGLTEAEALSCLSGKWAVSAAFPAALMRKAFEPTRSIHPFSIIFATAAEPVG